MVGQITPLEETDPTAAQQVREKMDALGLRTQFKMEDELAARAHRATQAAYLQDVNRQIAEIQDELLRNGEDRKSTRLNSSHVAISYAVLCLKKKNIDHP